LLKKILSHSILRSLLIIECVGLVLMIGAHFISGRHATLLMFILLVFFHILILFFSQSRIFKLFAKVQIEGQDAAGLIKTTQKFSKLAQISPPDIFLLDVPSAISFSFSHLPNSSAIFISETLVEDLSPAEIEALIAFEIARISLGQSFLAVIASSLGFVLTIFAEFIDKFFLLQFLYPIEKRKHFVELSIAPLITALSLFLVRKDQSLKADLLASEWLKDKKVLAHLLWKLDSLIATRPTRVRLCDSYLFTVNPLTNQTWSRYFLLQASVRHRIRKLVGHYPI
jgi:heat shock protein HtpX